MADIMDFSPLWGEWHIKELLGKGTFGAVYRAEKTEYGNTYESAVKHISIPSESMSVQRLIEEGVIANEESASVYYDAVRDQIIKEINFCYELKGHTNIVSYEDHCIIPKANGLGYDVFIRMEHLTPLTKYVRQRSFYEKDVIRIGVDICSALEILDKKHMIHRDIKPANIFVSRMGIYKLGDFGESKVLSGATAGMTVRGTFAYMSPEISMGHKADITADIYSLGIVLYRLLNGNKGPFIPHGTQAVSSEIQEAANVRRFRGEPLPPPQYCRNPALIQVVLKACEFLPEKRFQSPQEFRRALEAVLAGQSAAASAGMNDFAPAAAAPGFTMESQATSLPMSQQNSTASAQSYLSGSMSQVPGQPTSVGSASPPPVVEKKKSKKWVPIMIVSLIAAVAAAVVLIIVLNQSADSAAKKLKLYFEKPASWNSTVYAVYYNDQAERDAINNGSVSREPYQMFREDNGLYSIEMDKKYENGYVAFTDMARMYPTGQQGLKIENGKTYQVTSTIRVYFEKPAGWNDTVYAVYYNTQSELDAVSKGSADNEQYKMTVQSNGLYAIDIDADYKDGKLLFTDSSNVYPSMENGLSIKDGETYRVDSEASREESSQPEPSFIEPSQVSQTSGDDARLEQDYSYFMNCDYYRMSKERVVQDIESRGWQAVCVDVYEQHPYKGLVHSWTADKSTKTVTVSINQGYAYEVLDSQGVEIGVDKETVVITEGETATIKVTLLTNYDGFYHFGIEWKGLDIKSDWGDWTDEVSAPVMITGNSPGEAYVRIYFYGVEGEGSNQTETKIAYKDVYVTILSKDAVG